ncbi:TRAP transporter small permease [Xanthobacter sp. KR7-65]|uniref:TRAP transporter small permease subunit n=1 Tax=Xanthobacter sp. KR7-65 TaxID=3156612 RepID=UPI0032B3681E
MRRAARALDHIAEVLGTTALAVAAVMLAIATAHILLEIFLRNVLATSTYAVDEVVGYGVGAMTVLAMAATLRRGEMIRVQLVLARLPPAARRMAEIGCALLALVPVLLLTRAFGLSTLRSFREHTVSTGLLEVPLWIPEAVFSFGLGLLALQLATYALRLAVDPEATITVADVTSE